MQSLAKFSSRLFVQQKSVVGSSFKHSVQESTFNKDRIFIKSWNNLQICRCLHVTMQVSFIALIVVNFYQHLHL